MSISLNLIGPLDEGKIAVVDFYTDWCGPCIMMKGIIARAIGQAGDKVQLIGINTDTDDDTPKKYGITALPTLLFYNGTTGELIHQFSGAKTQAELLALIEKLYGDCFEKP